MGIQENTKSTVIVHNCHFIIWSEKEAKNGQAKGMISSPLTNVMIVKNALSTFVGRAFLRLMRKIFYNDAKKIGGYIQKVFTK